MFVFPIPDRVNRCYQVLQYTAFLRDKVRVSGYLFFSSYSTDGLSADSLDVLIVANDEGVSRYTRG